jgi:hypothetical protein
MIRCQRSLSWATTPVVYLPLALFAGPSAHILSVHVCIVLVVNPASKARFREIRVQKSEIRNQRHRIPEARLQIRTFDLALPIPFFYCTSSTSQDYSDSTAYQWWGERSIPLSATYTLLLPNPVLPRSQHERRQDSQRPAGCQFNSFRISTCRRCAKPLQTDRRAARRR